MKENDHTFCLFIFIMDMSNSSYGDASFKLNFEGNHFLVSYSIQDYFNGTYYGCYVIPEDCFTLNIRLLFVNFAAYFDLAPCPLIVSIYKNHWCSPGNENKLAVNNLQPFCTSYKSNTLKHGMWIRKEKLFQYSERFLSINSSDMKRINIASNISTIKANCSI